jgi:hypothetical protein
MLEEHIINFIRNGKTFTDTNEHAHRQFMRGAVRRARISKNTRDVVLAILNIWFQKKAQGVMYPGRKKLARMGGVSVRTVATILAEMRAAGALKVISHGKGGRASTRYSLDMKGLILFLGYKLPEVVQGTLGKVTKFHAGFRPFALWQKRANFAHGLNNNTIQTVLRAPEEPKPAEWKADWHGRPCYV